MSIPDWWQNAGRVALYDRSSFKGVQLRQQLSETAGDVRYALRTWRRQPVFVAIAVLSLAAGIGLNTAVFSIINTIFLQTIRGVPQPERVAAVGTRVTYATFRHVRDNVRTLDGVAVWQPVGVTLRYRDLVVRRVAPAVSETYFEALRVEPYRGRFFAPLAPRTPSPAAEVVLDFEFWRDVLGNDPQVVGQTIFINETPATILGVAPHAFHGFGPERPPLWMAMGMLPAVRGTPAKWEDAADGGWRIFGRMRADTPLGAVNAELQALAATAPDLFPDAPLRADTGREQWAGAISDEKRIEFLLVVVLPLVVVALILWIGCSNVANLLLARAAARRKEMAIRMANGAGRTRLIRLLLTESLLLALAGGAAGLLLAVWCRDLIWTALPEAPRLAVELDLNVLLYTAAVSVAATMLFGLLPALHATRVDIAPLLKSEQSVGSARRGGRIRSFFLVTQFAASTALLIVAGTFVRTVVATHLGDRAVLLDRLSLASIETPESSPAARAEYWRLVRERIREVPGVTALTLMPASGERTARLAPEGGSAGEHVSVRVQRVDSGFFPTSDVALVQGADLPADARVDPRAALVNERAARQLRLDGAIIGRRLTLDESSTISIVGIVRDDGADGRIYQRLSDGAVAHAQVLIRTAQPAATAIGPLRSAVRQMAAERTLTNVSTLRDASTGMLQRLTGLALVVAALVLSLAVVGLYGSVAFITAQRTREIAIRIAIGAPRSSVLRMLLWEGGYVVISGCAAGLALTAVAFRFMSGMIFANWTLEPVTIAGVLVVFSAATLAACYVPGRRATRIDPIQVLRTQ
jgi:predicted permease